LFAETKYSGTTYETFVCMSIEENKEKMDECHKFRAFVKKRLVTENEGFFVYS